MKEKGAKRRKDSSSSSGSDSESANSSSSNTPEKSRDKKHSKSTKSSKPSKRNQNSDDSDHKDTKSRLKKEETDSSKWDSPVAVENPKSSKQDKQKEDHRSRRSNSPEEHTSRKTDRHENRERDRYNQRKDNRQRDRSYEGRSRDSRNRNDNPRSGGSNEDKRMRSRERSPFRDNRRNFNNKDKFSKRRRSNSPEANFAWGKSDGPEDSKQQSNVPKVEKEKPNFQLSGKLTEETNTYRGVVIKYSEPPDSRKPKRRWRLYPFKGEKAMQTLYIHRQSAYLMGRDRKIVDLPIDHPSCSKQHAVLQYRLVPFERDDGSSGKRVRPYIIDLESANGTFINNNKIEPKKYVELLEKDVLKFGFSSREYVLLHENSKDEAQDDDVKQEEEEVNIKEEPKDE